MQNLDEMPVAIVGGGIAGLALGRALQAAGLPFHIVERRQTPADGGLAINLPGNAIHALAMLGLRDQIETIGQPLRRREYRTSQDKLLFEVDEDSFWGPWRRPRSVRRSELLAMLTEGLRTGAVSYGTDVLAVTSCKRNAELTLATGARMQARLIVGADGVRSAIRTLALSPDQGPGHALLAEASWRFMAPNPGVDCWTVWAGAEGMVLLMPVDGGEVYGWAAITRRQQSASTRDALVRLTESFPGRVKQAVWHALTQAEGLYHSPLEEVRLRQWHRGQAVLIGDAAHATAPVWAEGAALALEDAIVLARCLNAHSEIPAALSDFENQRRPRVAHVQALTDAMSRAAKLPPFLRNALLPIVGPKRYRQTYHPLKSEV